nr:mediator of RNA polymerase II transcription subunit 10B [Tanacetum cinerariifolium]
MGGVALVILIDDGKNPDEFTRDVLNSCIAKNQITKGKTDAFKEVLRFGATAMVTKPTTSRFASTSVIFVMVDQQSPPAVGYGSDTNLIRTKLIKEIKEQINKINGLI